MNRYCLLAVRGGGIYDAIGAIGSGNDLWKFDGTMWTWVSGSNAVNQAGAYGTKNVVAASNSVPARSISASWIDNSGNFWIFGGSGSRNDLWFAKP